MMFGVRASEPKEKAGYDIVPQAAFDKMSVHDLRQFAQSKGIYVAGLVTKRQLLTKICGNRVWYRKHEEKKLWKKLRVI